MKMLFTLWFPWLLFSSIVVPQVTLLVAAVLLLIGIVAEVLNKLDNPPAPPYHRFLAVSRVNSTGIIRKLVDVASASGYNEALLNIGKTPRITTVIAGFNP